MTFCAALYLNQKEVLIRKFNLSSEGGVIGPLGLVEYLFLLIEVAIDFKRLRPAGS